MENRINQSILNHHNRDDCSKSLLCTYHDLIRLDEINAFKIVECFGVRIDDLCHIGGTVITMFMMEIRNKMIRKKHV